jgi:predicted dehydrogenase
MVDQERPNIVHVLTPPQTHKDIIEECLKGGCNVISEKPVTLTENEFRSLCDLADGAGIFVTEDHNYLYNRPIPEVFALLDNGTVGTVVDVDIVATTNVRDASSRYSDRNLPHPSHQLPGGVVHDFLPHLVYLSTALATRGCNSRDYDPSIRYCEFQNSSPDGVFKFDEMDAVITMAHARLRLRYSVRGKPPGLAFTVRGTRGTVSGEIYHPFLVINTPGAVPKLSGPLNLRANGRRLLSAWRRNFLGKLRGESTYDGVTGFLQDTYGHVSEGKRPPIDHDSIKQTLRIVDSLIASGMPV